jgi:hypothetical protein
MSPSIELKDWMSRGQYNLISRDLVDRTMRSVGNDIVSMYYSILDQRRAETPEDDWECTDPIGVRDPPLTKDNTMQYHV